MKTLIRNEVTRCQPASLRKKLFHISSFTHYDYFFRRGFETVRAKFLSGNISGVLLVIYLFNYSSSRSTFFMLNVAFDFVLVWFSSSKLEFMAIQRLQKHSFFLNCIFWYVVPFNKKLIVLYHDDNTFLFYFDICIKVTPSAIILTMEKW